MARPSFQIDDEAADWVESRLVPGQSKSAWYRYATKTMIQCDAYLDDLYEHYQYEERQEFIEAAVVEKIERAKNKSDMTHENLVGENGEE